MIAETGSGSILVVDDRVNRTLLEVEEPDIVRDLLTAPAADLVYVDEVTVRGRSAPTRVWGLPEPASTRYASVEGSGTR